MSVAIVPALAGRHAVKRPLYQFRPAARRDLPMLWSWLQTPDVSSWWGDPPEQMELLRNDLDDPRMAMRIVSCDGRRIWLFCRRVRGRSTPSSARRT
jgi:hypothetical protein